MEKLQGIHVALLISVIGVGVSHYTHFQSADKPYVVFMLVDDWGWANVGYHRDPQTCEVDNPSIDSLVKEGLELDQHVLCIPVQLTVMLGSE